MIRQLLDRFKKPVWEKPKYGFVGWHKLKFCWLPVDRFYSNGHGRIVYRGKTWLRWAPLTKNLWHGWIHIENQD